MSDQADRRILTINTGSSSLKIGLYEMDRGVTRILSSESERIGASGGRQYFADTNEKMLCDQKVDFPDHGTALQAALAWLRNQRPELTFNAVGHRIVQGGRDNREPRRITSELIATLQGLIPIAPDHLPQSIQLIQIVTQFNPGLPQVACFDTAFHQNMPRIAQRYPLPRRLMDGGVIRYGFHGLSCEYIMQKLHTLAPQEAAGRIIIAHLGNGASMTAVRNGKSVDTTMGFTPAGGLMMGTRSGDIDPGVLLYLLSERRMTSTELNEAINRQAGLLGVSGISSDMRDLLERESFERQAAEAVELFCYQAKKYLGALAASLGGLDALIFTGGIGEHAAPVRWRIGTGLEFLGVKLDSQLNAGHASVISRKTSPVSVRVLRTDEDLMIAQHTHHLLESSSPASASDQ